MAITQESVVNQIEVTENNSVQVRIAIRVLNGTEVISSRWHRTAFDMTGNFTVDEQMAAVNEHLASMGEAPVGPGDIARVAAFHQLAVDLTPPTE